MESQLEQQAPAAAVVRGQTSRRHRGILRYPVVRQLIRFTGVGIVCTLTSLALYALSRPWLGAQPANAAALILTSFMNTALNRRLTFKITETRRMKRDHLNGLIVILVALLITGGSLAVLHWVNPECHRGRGAVDHHPLRLRRHCRAVHDAAALDLPPRPSPLPHLSPNPGLTYQLTRAIGAR